MSNVISVSPQNIDVFNYNRDSNHRCCPTISKVVNMVIDFFKKTCLMVRNTTFLLIHRVVHGKTIVSSSQCLINSKMDYASRNQIYKAVAAISIDDRTDVIVNVKSLIKPEMEVGRRVVIINAVAALSVDRRKGIENVVALIKPEMEEYKIIDVIGAVAAIPVQEREGIKNAAALIKPEMDIAKIVAIIQAVAKIPVSEREGLEKAAALIKPEMDAYKIVDIIGAIGAISIEKRGLVITKAKSLIKQESWVYMSNFISNLTKILQEPTERGIKIIESLIKPGMSASKILDVIGNLATIFQQEGEEGIKIVELIIDSRISEGEANVFEAIVNLPLKYRKDFISKLEFLITPEMSGFSLAYEIGLLCEMLQQGGEEGVAKAISLINLSKKRNCKNRIIRKIGEVPFKYRKDVIETANKLIADSESRQNVLDLIISDLAQLFQEEGEEGINKVIALIKPEVQGVELINIIKNLVEIPFKNRKDVLENVASLNELRKDTSNTDEMIKAVAEIKVQEKSNVMTQIRDKIKRGMASSEVIEMIKAASKG